MGGCDTVTSGYHKEYLEHEAHEYKPNGANQRFRFFVIARSKATRQSRILHSTCEKNTTVGLGGGQHFTVEALHSAVPKYD